MRVDLPLGHCFVSWCVLLYFLRVEKRNGVSSKRKKAILYCYLITQEMGTMTIPPVRFCTGVSMKDLQWAVDNATIQGHVGCRSMLRLSTFVIRIWVYGLQSSSME